MCDVFAGVILEPGKQYENEPDLPLHLSMATIQPATKDSNASVVSVYCHSGEENEKYLICSLHPGNTYQVPLDLTFIEGQTVVLSTEGPGKVHVTGYYMPETDIGFDDEDDSELEDEAESEEDEAVVESQKRPNSTSDATGPSAKKVKTEAKKEVAKVNGQKGKAIVPEQDSDEDDDEEEGQLDEESDDDAEDLNALLADIKKARAKTETGAGDKMQVSAADADDDEDDGEEDGDDDDEDDDEDMDDEEESDEENVAQQQKKLKQSLNKSAASPAVKQENGSAVKSGFQQKDAKSGQFGGRGGGGGGGRGGGFQQRSSGGGHRGGGSPHRGRGGFQSRGSPGNRGGGGFRGRGGRGGGGGTPFNKNKNFGGQGSHQKQANAGRHS